MVGIQYGQLFVTIGRRHVYEQGRFTVEIEPHDLPVFQTVRVKLTNANTGDFLYEGEFRVTLNLWESLPKIYRQSGEVPLHAFFSILREEHIINLPHDTVGQPKPHTAQSSTGNKGESGLLFWYRRVTGVNRADTSE